MGCYGKVGVVEHINIYSILRLYCLECFYTKQYHVAVTLILAVLVLRFQGTENPKYLIALGVN